MKVARKNQRSDRLRSADLAPPRSAVPSRSRGPLNAQRGSCSSSRHSGSPPTSPCSASGSTTPHQVAARGIHNAGGLNSVLVAVTGESRVDGHPKPFPLAATALNRLEYPPCGPVMSRVPHTKSALGLEDPRAHRSRTVGLTGVSGRKDLSLPDPFHRQTVLPSAARPLRRVHLDLFAGWSSPRGRPRTSATTRLSRSRRRRRAAKVSAVMETVDYLILYVRDLEVEVAFYRDVIGLPVNLQESGYAEFATSGTKFALYERSRLADLIGATPPPWRCVTSCELPSPVHYRRMMRRDCAHLKKPKGRPRAPALFACHPRSPPTRRGAPAAPGPAPIPGPLPRRLGRRRAHEGSIVSRPCGGSRQRASGLRRRRRTSAPDRLCSTTSSPTLSQGARRPAGWSRPDRRLERGSGAPDTDEDRWIESQGPRAGGPVGVAASTVGRSRWYVGSALPWYSQRAPSGWTGGIGTRPLRLW